MGDAVLEAEETQADFLFLRQLGQDASSVRISDPLNLDNSETSVNLICVSNTQGLLFAATNDGFIAHQLAEVRRLCASSSRKESPRLESPLAKVATTQNSQLGAKVTFLRVADQEQRLVVGLANGRIAIWLVSDLVQSKTDKVTIMQPPSPNHYLLELAPNPSDRPELCIALYGASDRRQLQCGTAICFDVRSGQRGSELRPSGGGMATSLCWSVRGKQVVLGLQDGSLAQMTPEGQPKDIVPKAEGLTGSPYVEQVVWLENHVFLVTYNQPPSSEEPEHQYEVYSILRDTTSKTNKFVHFTDPAPPFGDTAKRGHRFTSWIKSWEPTKHMLFLANTSSTDVGLLGCLSSAAGPSSWRNLDLEDTSRPVLPFSSIDQSADTCPVGLELDCTAEDNVDDPQAANRGEDGKGKLCAMPILYIYTNDGLLLAYTVINVDSKAEMYPGMVKTGGSVKAEVAEVAMSTEGSSQSAPGASPFAYPPAPAPAFGASTGLGGFGASTPAFGQSASIGAKAASPFSFNPSGSTPAASTPAPSASSGGFGAFATKPSNAFGSPSPSFSFNGNAANASVAPAFGASSTNPPSVFGSGNASATPTSSFGQTSTPAFQSSSAFGQASAFGAAAIQKSPFASASTSSSNAFSSTSTPASSSGFGGFASKATSSFGAPATSSSSSSSIFGSGGNLQGNKTSSTPIFGQSALNTSAKPVKSGPEESAELVIDDGDAGSLSFGGLGGLLGGDNKKTAGKDDKFTFGSKQNATFSPMPTPTPFSFANTTTPKKEESKPISFGNGTPAESAAASANTDTANEVQSTTPSSSPVKEIATPAKSAFPSTTPSSSPLKTQAASSKSGDETIGKETGENNDGDGAEEDWEEEEEEDEEHDESGQGEVVDEEDANESRLEEVEEDTEEDQDDEENEGGSEVLDAKAEEQESPHEDQGKANEAAVLEQEAEKSADLTSKLTVSDKKEVKIEKKSPTSFNFFPTPQTKTAATLEPPVLALEPTSTPQASNSSPTIIERPQPSTFPSAEASTASLNASKGQPFLNFSNRAPRSSSPLSGLPLNRADLPPSPDKASLSRSSTNSALFSAKAPAVQSPATFAQVQQRSSLAEEVTPKFSISNAKAEPKEVEGEGLQGIFLQTFLTMERELKVLTDNVKRCSEFQEVVREPNAKALGLYDLSDETMWTFGELDTKSKLSSDLTRMAEEVSQDTRALKLSLKEIQSQHLKIDVKREEIARFVRARTDPSFGKMVRVKQLGPEHAENQTRLRKATMSLREGIEELEAFLEKTRRTASDQRTGEAGALRAPSLDTIRRTARNITHMAQLRLMELQELELSYDQMTHNKPVFMRSTNGIGLAGAGQDALDSMSSIRGALPSTEMQSLHYEANGKGHFSAATALDMQKKHLDLMSVFRSGWKEPVLTRVAQKKDIAADDYRMWDLDMAFAKGTIRVEERIVPPPKVKEEAPVETVTPASASAPFSLSSGGLIPSNGGKPSFSFSPLPSTALPAGAFQMPPEQAPFAPGSSSLAGRAHVSKYGGKRNTAVALPTTSSPAASSGSDFFAMPTKGPSANSAVKSSLSGSTGAGFSFGNGTASAPSLSSRIGPNITFKGLQPMQPVVSSKLAQQAQVYYEDDSDSEEDRPAYEDENGHAEGGDANYDDDDDEYEDEEEQEGDDEGLSDVQEGDEE